MFCARIQEEGSTIATSQPKRRNALALYREVEPDELEPRYNIESDILKAEHSDHIKLKTLTIQKNNCKRFNRKEPCIPTDHNELNQSLGPMEGD